MSACHLCPRACGASRTLENPGLCGIRTGPGLFRVARVMAHFWEEPYISGSRGSGTVFFSGCPLGCRFCQNHRISQLDQAQALPGTDLTMAALSQQMQELAAQGVHNFNLVTAGHFAADVPALVETLHQQGTRLPIVWNTSAYESVATLRRLDGFIDVYLPDFKFWDSSLSAGLSRAPDYARVAALAIGEMYRQQPVTVSDAEGLLVKGVALRLLVLPGHHRDAFKILDWISSELPSDCLLAIMNQYTPFPELFDSLADHPEMKRRLTTYEYDKVIEYAQKKGLSRLLGQERSAANARYTPDFPGPVPRSVSQ